MIRRLNIDDSNSVVNLLTEACQESPKSFSKVDSLEDYQNILSNPDEDDVIYGAFVDNELIGLIGIHKNAAQEYRYDSWGLYILPNFRRRGIGKRLIKSVILHATKKVKSNLLTIIVESENINAMRLYYALGFQHFTSEVKFHAQLGEYKRNVLIMYIRSNVEENI